jgi:pimeloyl-ACP methyl ester carboxylesterase
MTAMAGYVELGEVRTWYDEQGEGEPVVLLHAGGADARASAPNIELLAARFRVFTPERRGHGRIRTRKARSRTTSWRATRLPSWSGWSAAARASSAAAPRAWRCWFALRRPELVRRLVLIAGVFHRDGWVPEVIDADASPPEALARGYAELSPDGADHLPVGSAKLARMN